jgi:hypothetical protein
MRWLPADWRAQLGMWALLGLLGALLAFLWFAAQGGEPEMQLRAHQWWIRAPIRSSLVIAVIVGAVAAAGSGFAFYRWASKDASAPRRAGRQVGRPPWLDVAVGGVAISYGGDRSTGKEISVSVPIEIKNSSKQDKASMRFFLVDTTTVERRMNFAASASQADVTQRAIPTAPGMADIFAPFDLEPEAEVNGSVWFFHPSWQTIPFKAMLVEETISGHMWAIAFPPEVHGLPKELGEHGRATVWPAPTPLR